MALLDNSYGDTTEIGALTPLHTSGGVFDATTRPTLTTVESSTDQVSGILNSILSQNGFAIPISQADVKLALDGFVNHEVAAIVEGINGSGRFGPTSKQVTARGRFALILDDVETFVEGNANGFERLGATRTQTLLAGLATRSQDEQGNDTFPIFQRKSFGETFKNWDNK